MGYQSMVAGGFKSVVWHGMDQLVAAGKKIDIEVKIRVFGIRRIREIAGRDHHQYP